MQLRPYQRDCLAAILDNARTVSRRQLIVQATGLGKAVQMASLPDALHLPRNLRMMVLVHRDELAYQMAEKLESCNPDRSIGIEKAQHRADNADLVVGSVQTLGNARFEGDEEGRWEYSDRLRQFNPDQFVIIQPDECHHISPKSKQWLTALRYFKVLKSEPDEDKRKLLCGWTATPNRADQLGLEVAFDCIAYEYGIRNGIQDGWLAPIIGYRVETEIDISRVRTVAGDLSAPDLSHIINCPERNSILADKYLEICQREPSLFFTVSIQHSVDLAKSLTDRGLVAYPLSSNTPDHERKRIISAFKAGDVNAITSCSVISEGVDLPNARAGFMCRPTKSGLLYRQQVGRVLRLYPSPEEQERMRLQGVTPPRQKPNAIIVDACDVSGRHHLVTASTLFGLNPNFDLKGESGMAVSEEIERIEAEHPTLDLADVQDMDEVQRRLERLKTNLHQVDLLNASSCPPEIRQHSHMNWIRSGESSYHLSLVGGEMITVRQNALGGFDVSMHVKGIRTPIGSMPQLQDSLKIAEGLIPSGERQLHNADAAWRSEPLTEKQARVMTAAVREYNIRFRGNPVAFYNWAIAQYRNGDMRFSRGAISSEYGKTQLKRA